MGYYTRVFCSSKIKPKVNLLIEYLTEIGHTVWTNPKELEDDWTDFELMYDSERLPLLIELNEKGNSDGLAEQELLEFFEFIGKANIFELSKKKVISHLDRTEYIVCIQLPTNDIIDEGYDVNGNLMSYLERNFSGMTHADREGFYLNNKLLLKIK
ncbi:hypothetical protein [Flavobacterium sp.]|uniref:hypothetical protein n=1 Tax=Flavobacterium sp. TaxID=239 RepID=UPI000EE5E2C8|nr:hypothetical protein [Flavobacterium sp.]HCQ14214.1 hypothetical protein [Flavobacterium sp.]